MAVYRVLTRCAGVRLKVAADDTWKRVTIEPDDDDLNAATDEQVVAVWDLVGRWAEAFRHHFPGWRVNGIDNQPRHAQCLRASRSSAEVTTLESFAVTG